MQGTYIVESAECAEARPGGRYELGRPVGEGSCGRTFEVVGTGEPYVVKLFVGAPAGLLPVAAQGDARALRDNEVRKLMPLREQAIGAADAAHFPQLHSTGVVVSGDAAGMPAFMMSRMRGRALSGCVDELSGAIGGVPTAQALLALLRCALRPLAVLERVGIVHGDLNLGNVFVELAEGPDGAAQPVWVGLVDLGAARGAGLLTTRTGVPSVHGAAAFTAPEILDPESEYHEAYHKDPRANVWALASLVYYLRTRRPYIAHTRLRLGEAKGDEPAARALLAEALTTCLSVDPRRRMGARELMGYVEARHPRPTSPESLATAPATPAPDSRDEGRRVPMAQAGAALYSDGTLVLGGADLASCRDGATLERAWDLSALEADPAAVPWGSHAHGVRRVVCEAPVAPTSTRGWFANMDGCESMDLSRLDFSRVYDATRMFSGCGALSELAGLDAWDTSSLECADHMFAGCLRLPRSVVSDLERWDVGRLKSSLGMFTGAAASLEKPRFWSTKYGRSFI